MIRHLIIPGIAAAAAHAVVLLTPPEKPPLAPTAGKPEQLVIDLPQLPPIPPDPGEVEDKPLDLPELKVLPLVFETISPNAESVFTVLFNPVIPPPNLTGNITMIPPGDYVEAGRRGMGKGVSDLFSRDDLDNKPRTLFQAAPEYPYALKTQGVGGEVVVTFTVDESGNVQDVRVVRSSHAEFEVPTVRAVSRWRFEPGRKDGRRVKFRMSVPVAFTLNDDN